MRRTPPPCRGKADERLAWMGVLPVVVPTQFLLIGSAVGMLGTLDSRVAMERLIGILVADVLATLGVLGLARANERVLRASLLAGAVVALLAGAWVIAASGPSVF